RGLVEDHAFVTEKDRAVLAVARLHAAAERHEVLVGIDDCALGRLCSPRIVLATVEGHPAPPVFITSADLWPGQSTAHAASSKIHPRRCPVRGFPTRRTTDN